MDDDTPLAQQHCRPMTGRTALSPAQWAPLLAQTPGWHVAAGGGAIEKRFAFGDYAGAIAFAARVAAMADAQDHHPELLIGWGRCTVRWDTHDVGGLSVNDFICAARTDALATAAGGASP